ncbi:MAG: OmpW family outer membrane protein [Betaproteobacteria bacterium]
MKLHKILLRLILVGVLLPVMVQSEENPWMLRVRGVDLLFQNGQSGGNGYVQALNISAQNRVIPEFDISYFFNKNISLELVLTYPQNIDISATNATVGTINALPPSLVAQYHFTNYGQIVPYVGAGINYTIFGNRTNFPALGNSLTVDQSSVGFVGQVGFDYMFTKNWGLNVDLKYITMSTGVTTVANGTNYGTLTLNPWTPAVGVTYKF